MELAYLSWQVEAGFSGLLGTKGSPLSEGLQQKFYPEPVHKRVSDYMLLEIRQMHSIEPLEYEAAGQSGMPV